MSDTKLIVTKSKLDALATSISTKSGVAAPMTIAQMKAAVDGIAGGGSIIQDEDGYLMFGSNGQRSLTIENIITGEYPNGRTILNATTIDSYRGTFHPKQSWTVYAPNCKILNDSAFRQALKMTIAVFPAITTINTGYCFYQCANLTIVDLFSPSSIPQQLFNMCSAFNVLIIRNNSISTLGNINAFASTPFASGKAGGTLYVPSALISSYQSATNWSTILSYENNQILPIEGSIYKTQYADGTPISN